MARSTDGIRQVAALMRDIDFCMLTTYAEHGGLHTRPMSNNGEVEFDGDVWFFAERASRKVREIERDPRVSLSFSAADRGIWLALEGDAAIVDDVEKKRSLWLDELDRWFENGPDDDDVVLIKVAAQRAEQWGEQDGVVEFG